jgi:nucleotide-binding universal stress UspA family protein
MIDIPLQLLLCTNGHPATYPALEMGLRLAGSLHCDVTLLGILESESAGKGLDSSLDEYTGRFQEAGIHCQVWREKGKAVDVISHSAQRDRFLTVVGPMGRSAVRRAIQGRSFRRLLAMVETPILYVPVLRWPVQRMLVCLGGLGYAVGIEHLSLSLAQVLKAQVTVMHVVEPVTLDYPTSRQVHDHWQDILKTDTPQGSNLRQAMQELQAAGIDAQFRVRHGSIIHEVLDEIKDQSYQMIGMGSQYSTHSLRHLYLPNVTAEVAESAACPILTARPGSDLFSR